MPDRTTPLILLLLVLCACGDVGAGLDAYRAGRYEEAFAILSTEVEAQGDDASAELLYDHALAALRVGRDEIADRSGARAVRDGSPEVAALAEFVRGNAAFARAGKAELQAATVEAEPFAHDLAINHAKAAAEHWSAAAASRHDWPAARRNVERALAKVLVLEAKRDAAAKNRDTKKDSGGPPAPKPGGGPDEQDPTAGDNAPQPGSDDGAGDGELSAEAERPGAADLSPQQVLALLDRLAEREAEKRAARRAEQRARRAEVERDW